MQIKSQSEEDANQLQDNVVLIINGLSESGRILAEMLAKQGADIAIIDFGQAPELAHRIQQEVEMRGRRCLVLTANELAIEREVFPEQAVQTIINTLGRLDAFITYSAAASADEEKKVDGRQNGHSAPFTLFDQHDLTKAVLRHILI